MKKIAILLICMVLISCSQKQEEMEPRALVARNSALNQVEEESYLLLVENEEFTTNTYLISGGHNAFLLDCSGEDLEELGYSLASLPDPIPSWALESSFNTNHPPLVCSTSPVENSFAYKKIDRQTGLVDYYLYFFEDGFRQNLYRPGCLELAQKLGFDDDTIAEGVDPVSLVEFYYDAAPNVVEIGCVQQSDDDDDVTFSEWCESELSNGATLSTVDALLAHSGEFSCEAAEQTLKQSTVIDLSGYDIQDVRPLVALGDENIEEIVLSGNKNLENLEALSKYDTLRRLVMRDCDLSSADISFLEDIRIEEIDLSTNKIKNLAVFAELNWPLGIRWLNLSHNLLSDTPAGETSDAQPPVLGELSTLSQLRYLDISFNEIRDLSPLTGLEHLVSLVADHNIIDSVEPLSTLVNLETFTLSHNQLGDLRPLRNLTALETMDAGHNELMFMRHFDDWCKHRNSFPEGESDPRKQVIDELLARARDQYLEGEIRRIDDSINEELGRSKIELKQAIKSLQSNPDPRIEDPDKLIEQWIEAWEAEQQALEERRDELKKSIRADAARRFELFPCAFGEIITNWTKLSLYGAKFSNISPLSALFSLEKLDLGNNEITTIEPLEELTRLTWLNLEKNAITQFGYLRALSALEYLSLAANNLEAAATEETSDSMTQGVICGWTRLTALDLSSNGNFSWDETLIDNASCPALLTLTDLNLNNTGSVQTISSLQQFENLQRLQLREVGAGNEQMEVFSTPGVFPDLSHLDVSKNTVTTLSPFAQLTGLKSLIVRETQLANVSALETMVPHGLSHIDLFGNVVSGESMEFLTIGGIVDYFDVRNQTTDGNKITTCPLSALSCYVD